MIAVVVAARNESKNITHLIKSLKEQNYLNNRISFWIVDDDSDDDTYALANSTVGNDKRFHILKTDNSIPIASPKKRALDTAIRMADAEWIVTTDADCLPSPDWLASLSYYMEHDVGVIVGYAPLFGGKNPVEWLMEGESWSAASLAAAGIGLGFPFNAMGRNFAFRRKMYHDMGGYGFGGKMASGDDDLFLQHVAAKTNWKVRFAFDPSASVPSEVPRWNSVYGTKSRHMSVGPRYAPGWVVIGFVGNLLFMGLALLSVISIFRKSLRKNVLTAWQVKWACDLLMSLSAYRVLGDTPRAAKAFAAMSAAPFALWAIWPKALLGSVSWKGRTFQRGQA